MLRSITDIDPGWNEDRAPDRRDAFRRRVRRKARIVVNAGWSTFDAQIVNLSPFGAGLEMLGFTPVPEYFELRYDHVKVPVRRVWLTSNRIGVAFES